MEKYTHTIKELLGGNETIHLFQTEKKFGKIYSKTSKQNAEREFTFQKSVNNMMVCASFISSMTFYIVTLFSMFLVFDGVISMDSTRAGYLPRNRFIRRYGRMPMTLTKVTLYGSGVA